MRNNLLLILAFCNAGPWPASTQAMGLRYQVIGIVLTVDPAHRTCAAIPNYMEAMSMPYSVLDAKTLGPAPPRRLHRIHPGRRKDPPLRRVHPPAPFRIF
jgi:hypothetical protein